MNPDDIHPRPTIADEVKLGVDDAQVIAKTLPPAPSPVRKTAVRVKGEVDHAVQSARGYVAEWPVRSVLIAAAGGAMLTAGLLAWMRDPPAYTSTPSRLR